MFLGLSFVLIWLVLWVYCLFKFVCVVGFVCFAWLLGLQI